jgi:hypothetical protein
MNLLRAIFGAQREVKMTPDDPDILKLKLQVAELATKQQEGLVKSEELQSKQRDLLRELTIYAWAGRAFVTILLGGTIVGAFTLPAFLRAYVNKRVEAATNEFEDLQLGLSLAWDNQSKIALFQLEDWVKNRKASGRPMSTDLRTFLLRVRLWLLAYLEEVTPDGNYVGLDHWQDLLRDPDFKRDFIENKKWVGDSRLAEFLGFCYLKYDSSPNFITAAEDYFKSAAYSAEHNPDRAPYLTYLGMLDLVAGRQKAAVEKFLEASADDPVKYSAGDKIKNKNSFLSGSEFLVWSRTAKRLGVPAFDKVYVSAMDDLEKSIPPTTGPELSR